MSDAYTDMSRDNNLSYQINKIVRLEEEFCNFPSEKIAKRIIKEYQEYITMRGGWSSPNKDLGKERISLFGEYLNKEISEEETKNYIHQENSRDIAQVTDRNEIRGVNLESVLVKSMSKRLEEFFSEDNNRELKVFIIPTENGLRWEEVPEEYLKKKQERIDNYEKYLPKSQ